MKPKPRIKTVEEVPLSPYEQSIEDATDETALNPATTSARLIPIVNFFIPAPQRPNPALTSRKARTMPAGKVPIYSVCCDAVVQMDHFDL